jgi:hypothetical protein
METQNKISLKGLRKEARKKFRNKRSTVLLNYGGMVFFLGGFLAWVLLNSTSSIAFALPVAIGMVAMIFSITKESQFVDAMIIKWSENGQQLPEGLKK